MGFLSKIGNNTTGKAFAKGLEVLVATQAIEEQIKNHQQILDFYESYESEKETIVENAKPESKNNKLPENILSPMENITNENDTVKSNETKMTFEKFEENESDITKSSKTELAFEKFEENESDSSKSSKTELTFEKFEETESDITKSNEAEKTNFEKFEENKADILGEQLSKVEKEDKTHDLRPKFN